MLSTLAYAKMAGCGNDFVLLDVRFQPPAKETRAEFARILCRRNTSIGADGLIFLELSGVADIKMDFYNADGSRGEMCGNGLRCLARYAADNGICPPDMTVETGAGLYRACCCGSKVKIYFPPVMPPRLNVNLEADLPPMHLITVGVPHAVLFAADSWDWSPEQVQRLGRRIRNHHHFPRGTNVNWVSKGSDNTLQVRTYERGVEAETSACGTGATAAALVASRLCPGVASPAGVRTRGGELRIGFEVAQSQFQSVWLEGEAVYIASGRL